MDDIIKITPTRVIANNGKFDSEKRYLKQTTSGIAVFAKGGRCIFRDSSGRVRIAIGGFVLQDVGYTGAAVFPASFVVTGD